MAHRTKGKKLGIMVVWLLFQCRVEEVVARGRKRDVNNGRSEWWSAVQIERVCLV